MQQEERIPDPQLATTQAMDGHQAQIWTALPGIIVSFNPAAMTVQVQPAIKGEVRAPGGTTSYVNLPVLPDVPVCFPGGGGATLTFPIAKGDECLVVFSSRSIDAWWQAGGVQPPLDARMHDLSDGFAIVGTRSKARALAGVSASTTQLRTDDGAMFVELAAGQVMRLVAPGGIALVTPTLTLTGQMIAQGDVTAGTISLQHHTHTDPQGGSVGPPV